MTAAASLASLGNGPAFAAYASATQTVTSGIETICSLDTKEFDTNTRFNNTGSTVNGIPAYAFLPNIPGYYQVNMRLRPQSSAGFTSITNAWISLQKNGSVVQRGNELVATTNNCVSQLVGSFIVYLNGTTDYIQLSGFVAGSGTLRFDYSGVPFSSYMSCFLARGA